MQQILAQDLLLFSADLKTVLCFWVAWATPKILVPGYSNCLLHVFVAFSYGKDLTFSDLLIRSQAPGEFWNWVSNVWENVLLLAAI